MTGRGSEESGERRGGRRGKQRSPEAVAENVETGTFGFKIWGAGTGMLEGEWCALQAGKPLSAPATGYGRPSSRHYFMFCSLQDGHPGQRKGLSALPQSLQTLRVGLLWLAVLASLATLYILPIPNQASSLSFPFRDTTIAPAPFVGLSLSRFCSSYFNLEFGVPQALGYSSRSRLAYICLVSPRVTLLWAVNEEKVW